MTEADARRVIVTELAARLRPVCSQWPQHVFDEMIERLAEITLKYDRGFATPSYDRRSTDRLVADLKSALERSKASRDGGARDLTPGEGTEAEGEPKTD